MTHGAGLIAGGDPKTGFLLWRARGDITSGGDGPRWWRNTLLWVTAGPNLVGDRLIWGRPNPRYSFSSPLLGWAMPTLVYAASQLLSSSLSKNSVSGPQSCPWSHSTPPKKGFASLK